MSQLAAWDSFYVIVGSAAGALIGLQFVVITLIADKPSLGTPEAAAAYATPTIVHFSMALLLSAVIRAPWQTITPVAAFWGLVGITGTAYVCVVAWRMRSRTSYEPEFEDWAFHVLLPLLAYLMLALSAWAAPFHAHQALFGAGGAVLLMLFIGIHNCWDAITYNVFVKLKKQD
jgi:hypothetical protein